MGDVRNCVANVPSRFELSIKKIKLLVKSRTVRPLRSDFGWSYIRCVRDFCGIVYHCLSLGVVLLFSLIQPLKKGDNLFVGLSVLRNIDHVNLAVRLVLSPKLLCFVPGVSVYCTHIRQDVMVVKIGQPVPSSGYSNYIDLYKFNKSELRRSVARGGCQPSKSRFVEEEPGT